MRAKLRVEAMDPSVLIHIHTVAGKNRRIMDKSWKALQIPKHTLVAVNDLWTDGCIRNQSFQVLV